MKTALRVLAAIFAGLLVSFIQVLAVEFFSDVVHPFPEDFKGTPEEIYRHVERCPDWVLAVALPSWAIAAFAGTWTARRIGNLNSAATVGLLLVAALVFNISQLPYPIWFKIGNLLMMPAAIAAGNRTALRHKTADAGEAK